MPFDMIFFYASVIYSKRTKQLRFELAWTRNYFVNKYILNEFYLIRLGYIFHTMHFLNGFRYLAFRNLFRNLFLDFLKIYLAFLQKII